MRRKSLLAGAIAIVGMLTVGLPVSTATTSSAATTNTCTFKNYDPTPNQPTGFTVGSVSCPQPFGPGVQLATYSTTVTATGALTQEGTYTNSYATGTTHGTYSLTGQFTSATAATLKGTVTETGGTGAFQGIKATGTLTCSTTDAFAFTTCTAVLTVTSL